MNTPICDFVRQYAESGTVRLHMPGHKGRSFLGMESLDITEINGADSLYEAEGIIARSEENASKLFGSRTLYSTEGSSQCIRAMLYLALLYARETGKAPVIAAARNVHKTFLSAAALLDLEVVWLYPDGTDAYLSCHIRADTLEEQLKQAEKLPAAVYLTSPDYLGGLADIREIAVVCRRYGILLLVDNAHGAYLKFLEESAHPIDLGADLCCDSAHKTLPVLTGGAYLHISPGAPELFFEQARTALALFGSTSPSYLILQSLDAANAYLDGYRERLRSFVSTVSRLKTALSEHGYQLFGQEPLKITIAAKKYGYSGAELAKLLRDQDIECEFADPDYLVLMLTPEVSADELGRLKTVLCSVPMRPPISQCSPELRAGEKALSVRDAMLAPAEILPVTQCEGRILSSASVGCPPAVPILVCGEVVDSHAVRCFRYYGVNQVSVVKKK